MYKMDILERCLQGLRTNRNVIGSAISSKNGLLMATDLPTNIDRNSFCAMAGSLFSGIQTAASVIGKYGVRHAVTNIGNELFIAHMCGNSAILLVNARSNVELEPFLKEISYTANTIGDVVG
jgi:predicted regulator of Ras-like GTPase activity (Roadblock/LC7/MglB family)